MIYCPKCQRWVQFRLAYNRDIGSTAIRPECEVCGSIINGVIITIATTLNDLMKADEKQHKNHINKTDVTIPIAG